MKRSMFLLYGVACYLGFLGTYAWMAGFVGNVLVPKSIDSPTGSSTGVALLVNTLLIALFGLQHSIMARPAFKNVWTRAVPKPIERSTYVLLSCVAILVLMAAWQPLPAVVWEVQNTVGWWLLTALCAAGWLMVPAVSLMIDHFDLFGLRQVWLHWRGQEYTAHAFRTPLLYRYIRHPLYVGWALAFWATPTMTVGHLFFAVTLTGYMLLAALIEERDLVAFFGRQYEEYQQRVPRYIPRLFGRSTVAAVAENPTQMSAPTVELADTVVFQPGSSSWGGQG